MMRRFLAYFLSLTLLLSGCSGSPKNENSNPTGETDENSSSISSISLPFIEGDSLNPYTVKSSLNIKIIPLLYDSLLTVDNSFGITPMLAEEIIKTDPLHISIKIKEGVKFSNGEPLSSEDVVFSFNQLKAMGSYFGKSLSVFSSATISENKIIFTLNYPDRYAENCLDFPISSKKAGTANPVGSGRYKLQGKELVPNDNYLGASDFGIKKISLTATAYSDSLFTAIKSGSIDIVPADLSLGSFTGTYSKTKIAHTSNLVYLGVGGTLSDLSLRKYISAAINREEFSSKIPASSFTASSLPLHPMKSEVFSLGLNNTKEKENALDLLGKEYSLSKEKVLFKGEEKISLTLLYSNDNSEKVVIATKLSELLSSMGIDTQLVGKNYNDYLSLVSSGQFDLYLGEIRLPNSLNLNPLMSSSSENLKTIYNGFCSGEKTTSEFLSAFSEELPFIPLMFKNSALVYSKAISNDLNLSVTDSYLSLQNIR